MTIDDALQRVVDFYEQLTPQSLSLLSDYYEPQAYFKDPFHEVAGVAAIEHIFRHMFELDSDAKFRFLQRFVSPNEPWQAMLIWQMSMTVSGRLVVIEGTSHLVFNEQGLLLRHRDYWDTGEELYAKLPLIGRLIRFLLAKGSAFKTAKDKALLARSRVK